MRQLVHWSSSVPVLGKLLNNNLINIDNNCKYLVISAKMCLNNKTIPGKKTIYILINMAVVNLCFHEWEQT